MNGAEPKHTADCRVDWDGVSWTCDAYCPVTYPLREPPTPRPTEGRRAELAESLQREAREQGARSDWKGEAAVLLETPGGFFSKTAEEWFTIATSYFIRQLETARDVNAWLAYGAVECERLRGELNTAESELDLAMRNLDLEMTRAEAAEAKCDWLRNSRDAACSSRDAVHDMALEQQGRAEAAEVALTAERAECERLRGELERCREFAHDMASLTGESGIRELSAAHRAEAAEAALATERGARLSATQAWTKAKVEGSWLAAVAKPGTLHPGPGLATFDTVAAEHDRLDLDPDATAKPLTELRAAVMPGAHGAPKPAPARGYLLQMADCFMGRNGYATSDSSLLDSVKADPFATQDEARNAKVAAMGDWRRAHIVRADAPKYYVIRHAERESYWQSYFEEWVSGEHKCRRSKWSRPEDARTGLTDAGSNGRVFGVYAKVKP